VYASLAQAILQLPESQLIVVLAANVYVQNGEFCSAIPIDGSDERLLGGYRANYFVVRQIVKATDLTPGTGLMFNKTATTIRIKLYKLIDQIL